MSLIINIKITKYSVGVMCRQLFQPMHKLVINTRCVFGIEATFYSFNAVLEPAISVCAFFPV